MNRDELRRVVADILELEPGELEPDTDLRSIEAFDSVSILSLMIELHDQAGAAISPMEASKLRCYGDIERLLEEKGVSLSD